MPLKYSSNQLITALDVQTNLEEKKKARDPINANHRLSERILFWQYVCQPKHLVNQGDRNASSNSNNKYFKYKHIRWKTGHKCRSGEIRGYVSKKLQNGTSAVHFVFKIVQSLKDDLLRQIGDEME